MRSKRTLEEAHQLVRLLLGEASVFDWEAYERNRFGLQFISPFRQDFVERVARELIFRHWDRGEDLVDVARQLAKEHFPEDGPEAFMDVISAAHSLIASGDGYGELLGEAEEKPDGWIGVDLDGTLARYTGWKGSTHIGSPIPRMVERVRRWVSHGKKVKIFTARADDEKSVNAIKKWLKDNELPDLEITNLKDEHMEVCYDDRAIHVHKNTGKIREALQHPSEEAVQHILSIIQTSKNWQEANEKLKPYKIAYTDSHPVLNQTGAVGGVWGEQMLLNARYFGQTGARLKMLLAHELTHTAQMAALKAAGGDLEKVTDQLTAQTLDKHGNVDMARYTRMPMELQALARNAVDAATDQGSDPYKLARSGRLARHAPFYPGDTKRFGKYAYQLMQQRKNAAKP